jgi:hypothetical protein
LTEINKGPITYVRELRVGHSIVSTLASTRPDFGQSRSLGGPDHGGGGAGGGYSAAGLFVGRVRALPRDSGASRGI